jgi:hypothetical protein
MVIRLFASSENTRGLKGNSNANLVTTPHRCNMVMETIGSWDELTKQFIGNFRSTYKRPTSIEEVKACV